MIKKVINSVFIAILSFVAWSCNSNIVSNPTEIIFPEKNISYSVTVQPFLTLSCGLGGCHSSESRAGNLRVTEYTYLMIEYPGLVAPNLPPEQNLLIQLLDGKVNHLVWDIPSRVKPEQVVGMKQWIKEGALNN